MKKIEKTRFYINGTILNIAEYLENEEYDAALEATRILQGAVEMYSFLVDNSFDETFKLIFNEVNEYVFFTWNV